MDLLEMSQNTLLLTFFIIGNVISIILFFIILVSNIASKNRETKNIYFNAVLVSQIFYFLIDIIWAIAYFNNLNKLLINDEVSLTLNKKNNTYIVKNILEQKKNGYINISKEEQDYLILTTCSPNHNGYQLIVNCIKKESL